MKIEIRLRIMISNYNIKYNQKQTKKREKTKLKNQEKNKKIRIGVLNTPIHTFLLNAVHFVVQTIILNQFIMRSFFNDLTIV